MKQTFIYLSLALCLCFGCSKVERNEHLILGSWMVVGFETPDTLIFLEPENQTVYTFYKSGDLQIGSYLGSYEIDHGSLIICQSGLKTSAKIESIDKSNFVLYYDLTLPNKPYFQRSYFKRAN